MPDQPQLPPIPGPPASFTKKPTSDPYLAGLENALRSEYPRLNQVSVSMMPWSDPDAGSNVLGRTPIHGGDQSVEINPSLVAFPQGAGLETLVHELAHTDQNRGMTPVELQGLKHAGATIPYEERPWEKQAYAAEQQYAQKHGNPEAYQADPMVMDAMPLHANVGKDTWHNFATSQLVKALQQLGFSENRQK